MRRKPWIIVVTLAALGILPSAAFAQSDFDGCGTLTAGVECLLFRADVDEKLYLISNRGDFVAGDRVRVTGRLNVACLTVCQQVSGCVEDNTITACPPEIDACGVLVQSVECTLFQPDGELRTYVVQNLGGFGVGQRVRVTGVRNTACLSICGQSAGCIVENTIRAASDDCPPATPVCPLASISISLLMPLVMLSLRGARKSASTP